MGRQAEFNDISNQIADNYSHFLDKLLSAYNRAILSTDLSARGIDLFRKEILNVQQQYLEHEVEVIVNLYDHLRQMIETDTKGLQVNVLEDEQWSAYLSDNTNFLYEAIKLQSQKDVLYITNFIRSKALQLSNMSDGQAAYTLIFNQKNLDFYYTDKLGRKINSIKYVRAVVRDYLVKNYNDMIVGAAILNGIKTLTVENVDANHRDNGKKISVTDENDVNYYFTIKDEIFHPNSNSILRL